MTLDKDALIASQLMEADLLLVLATMKAWHTNPCYTREARCSFEPLSSLTCNTGCKPAVLGVAVPQACPGGRQT